jgi:hypothetical protein
LHFNLLGGAMQAENVPKEVKDRLFLCFYSFPFRAISEQASAIVEANEELDASDHQDVFSAIVVACTPRQAQQQTPAE